ncbi:MAG: beta-propeller domain-containing protein [Candidatus Gracilibacteria bacterium]|nr:beta-propeller domain-containing protein [Candidatus Gracilibacteria bacterium]
MKKIIFSLLLFVFFTSIVYAVEDDSSVIEELTKQNTQELNFDFSLKSFSSCQNLEDVMGNYIKEYWKVNKDIYRYPTMYKGVTDDMLTDMPQSVTSEEANQVDGRGGGADEDYSKTNIQVAGVDESDIIKTDGDYIYYFDDTDKYVYIVNAQNRDNLEVVKKIKLPSYFYNPVLYIDDNRLVILSSGYNDTIYRNYWINRNSRTYAIVYDISNKTNMSLLKIYMVEGDLSKSRKIGDYVYLISNNYFNIPYSTFESEAEIDVSASSILPKKLEISRTTDKSEQNLLLNGIKYPYKTTAGKVANCNEIEYILPDSETLKRYNFNPSYNIISAINIRDTSKGTTTKVIAGSNSEIYMSLDNLYLTSNMYTPYNFRCPVGARCIMPFYYGGMSNTLIHKLAINAANLVYQRSTIVPGSPLNQYSMDEKDDYFRIITTSSFPESTTDLYILNESLALESSLTGLGAGESFQSSRFMGDKLFLVTFKQVDPLYAIDLSDQRNPEVLGELKIPGYSTYLHPYDENHLIGLGYDTYENEWGGTRNGGIKVDLYEVNYDKKCGDVNLTADEKAKCASGDYKGIIVKQAYSLALGDSGSYSEALNNPRLFMWNASKNTLLLPAQIYINESKTSYNHIDYFNGLIAININKDTGINEKYRITHIDRKGLEEKRTEDCKQYIQRQECRKLIDGSTYCPPAQYVPDYCYADATIGTYIASQSWTFRDSFIKRALWIGDTSYAVSNDKVSSHNISNGNQYDEVELR